MIGHRGHPLDEIVLKQSVHRHEHERNRAIATNIGFDSARNAIADDLFVDRVQDDDRIVVHSKRGGCVDPIARPTQCAELWKHFARVVATLTSDDDIHFGKRFNSRGRVQLARFDTADLGAVAASIGCRKEHRLAMREVVLCDHALNEHRTNHATPADKSNFFHNGFLGKGLVTLPRAGGSAFGRGG